MNYDKFRVGEGEKLNLGQGHFSPQYTGEYKNKEAAQNDLQANVARLTKLQDVLYAQNIHSLLIIFQALDAAGKDGAIKHVMSGVNPQGCSVVSFKTPSTEELDHDYMWRTSKNLPERGKIGIFNRSYYEDVLIVRVHQEILRMQKLPEHVKNDPKLWEKRFEQIRNFESYLVDNGIHVVKFFLNVSKDEQKKRFLDRINEPEKHWKFSASDIKERGHWDEYQKAYKEALQNTSTKKAPWYVIPADRKWFTRVAVSEIICQQMEAFDLKYPTISKTELEALARAKSQLEKE
jgi:PPK2 family polyphosphate:nucleotide phosphotransferase